MPTPPLSPDLAREAVEACRRAGSISGGARLLGIPRCTLSNRINAAVRLGMVAREEIADQRFNASRTPEDAARHMEAIGGDPAQVADGWTMHYDDDGRKLGSYRFKVSPSSVSDMADMIRDACADLHGKAEPRASVTHGDTDLLNLFPIPDAHLGLHSWARETGEDYNLSMAKELLRNALERVVARSPKAETAVLLGLGDLLHGNDQRNATPKSGHQLDVDGRHMKVMEVAVWTIIGAVEILLQTHDRVIVELLGGNHDPEAALMLLVALRAFYARESRVAVDQDARTWWTLAHGQTLLAATHGHAIKQAQMPGYLAAEWPDLWGQTRHRYIFSGHIHHERSREFPGVLCEALRPVTARDAYAAAAFVSQRELTAMTFHRRFGRIGRIYEALPLREPA